MCWFDLIGRQPCRDYRAGIVQCHRDLGRIHSGRIYYVHCHHRSTTTSPATPQAVNAFPLFSPPIRAAQNTRVWSEYLPPFNLLPLLPAHCQPYVLVEVWTEKYKTPTNVQCHSFWASHVYNSLLVRTFYDHAFLMEIILGSKYCMSWTSQLLYYFYLCV